MTKPLSRPAKPFDIQIDKDSVTAHSLKIFVWSEFDDGGSPIEQYILESRIVKESAKGGGAHEWHAVARIMDEELAGQLSNQNKTHVCK